MSRDGCLATFAGLMKYFVISNCFALNISQKTAELIVKYRKIKIGDTTLLTKLWTMREDLKTELTPTT